MFFFINTLVVSCTLISIRFIDLEYFTKLHIIFTIVYIILLVLLFLRSLTYYPSLNTFFTQKFNSNISSSSYYSVNKTKIHLLNIVLITFIIFILFLYFFWVFELYSFYIIPAKFFTKFDSFSVLRLITTLTTRLFIEYSDSTLFIATKLL